jgi:two-component system, NarL family, nitrate/nitrite response regulator NarL
MCGDAISPPRVKVLIAVDVRLYREGLASTLADRSFLHIVGTAATREEALAVADRFSPDLVLIDIALPEALALMRELRERHHGMGVLAYAVEEDISTILDCATAGATGYVSADASIDELVHAIERTAAGELLCSPRVAAALLRRAAGQPEERSAADDRELTSRQREVLSLLSRGFSNKQIGSALNIAEATVKNHVHHLLEKLRVQSRTQAAYAAASAPPPAVRLRQRPRSPLKTTSL